MIGRRFCLKLTNYICIVIFLFCFGILNAQEIVTDRPDQTESAAIVPKAKLQIESGFAYEVSEDDYGKYNSISAPSTLFRYGLFDFLELRFVHQYNNLKMRSEQEKLDICGFSDLEFGIKLAFIKSDYIDLALVSHYAAPTGTDGFGYEKGASINKIAVSHSLSDDISLGYNIGYDYFGQGKGDLNYSVVFGYSITDKLGIFIETYGDFVELKEHSINYDTGFTYLIEDNFQVDFSFGTGIDNKMNFISFGFGWLIK